MADLRKLRRRALRTLRSLRRGFPREREEIATYLARWRGRSLPEVRAVLFAQGRTGSTLLGELLGGHPDVCWVDEILGHRVRRPLRWVDGQARTCDTLAFGFHVKIYQLTTIQRISDPGAFLRHLHRSGWSVFHLWRRDVLRQVLSAQAAEQRGSFHDRTRTPPPARLRVDTVRLLRECTWRAQQHQLELEAMRGLPSATFCYEDDLLDSTRWQATADRAFRHLGLPSHPVTTTLHRLTGDSLEDLVLNLDEVRDVLAGTPFEAFVSPT